MKPIRLVLLLSMILTTMHVLAYDFEVDGIAYTITSISDLECAVSASDNGYSGKIIIPMTVEIKNKVLKVTAIESSAFKNNVNLTSVDIPMSVVSLEDETFYGCLNLQTVILPKSLECIGNSCFENCGTICDISLPSSLQLIGNSSFKKCSNLKKISLPNNLRKIGDEAFSYCALVDFKIPNSVTELGRTILNSCSNLKSFTIGNGIMELKSNPIKNCNNIEKIIIADGKDDLKFNFSDDDYQLHHRDYSTVSTDDWDAKYYYIRSGGFKNVKSKYVYIGRQVSTKYYKREEYNSMSKPTKTPDREYFYYDLPPFHGNEYVQEIELGQFAECKPLMFSCHQHGEYVYGFFENCAGLTTIKADKIEAMGLSFAKNAKYLKEVELSSIQVVPDEAFYGCSNLETITFGPNLNFLNKNSFFDCNKLYSIELKSKIPPICESEFMNIVYVDCTLHIPIGTYSLYESSTPWKNFWNIEETKEISGIDGIKADSDVISVTYYSVNGLKLKELPLHGVFIIKEVMTDGSVRTQKIVR